MQRGGTLASQVSRRQGLSHLRPVSRQGLISNQGCLVEMSGRARLFVQSISRSAARSASYLLRDPGSGRSLDGMGNDIQGESDGYEHQRSRIVRRTRRIRGEGHRFMIEPSATGAPVPVRPRWSISHSYCRVRGSLRYIGLGCVH